MTTSKTRVVEPAQKGKKKKKNQWTEDALEVNFFVSNHPASSLSEFYEQHTLQGYSVSPSTWKGKGGKRGGFLCLPPLSLSPRS